MAGMPRAIGDVGVGGRGVERDGQTQRSKHGTGRLHDVRRVGCPSGRSVTHQREIQRHLRRVPPPCRSRHSRRPRPPAGGAHRVRPARAASSDRRSTSIHASNGIEFTDVPPPTRPTLNVVFGVVGTSKAAMAAMARPMRVHRVRHPERPVAVTAWSLERRPIALAADPAVGDLEARPVDRHEPVDALQPLFAEQVLDAAQVPEPLFSDRADERDAPRRRRPVPPAARARRRAARQVHGSHR